MPKSNTRPNPTATRTLHVPKEYHQEIRILAGLRDEDIQEVTVQALKVGIKALKSRSAAPESCVSTN